MSRSATFRLALKRPGPRSSSLVQFSRIVFTSLTVGQLAQLFLFARLKYTQRRQKQHHSGIDDTTTAKQSRAKVKSSRERISRDASKHNTYPFKFTLLLLVCCCCCCWLLLFCIAAAAAAAATVVVVTPPATIGIGGGGPLATPTIG